MWLAEQAVELHALDEQSDGERIVGTLATSSVTVTGVSLGIAARSIALR